MRVAITSADAVRTRLHSECNTVSPGGEGGEGLVMGVVIVVRGGVERVRGGGGKVCDMMC